MIVVVGNPAWNPGPPPAPAGRAAGIARAAAAANGPVELVGRAGDDAAGDDLVLALAQAGVGHVALLRDPARPTRIVREPGPETIGDEPDAAAADRTDGEPSLEPADVALGLRYLAGFDVLVVSDDAPAAVLPECVAAAAYVGARLVIVVRAAPDLPDGVPPDATILEAPTEEGDAFARLVGTYAAALAGGTDPAAAFGAATSGGWERPDV